MHTAEILIELSLPESLAAKPGDERPLPAQFLIFRRGENKTSKGTFIFDDQAAKSVMAAAEASGVDLMIDLEHLSTEPEARHYDPDARGWLRLSVDERGNLVAADVRWTPDGARRLRERTQRYVSPWFDYDPKTRRILQIRNVAITAMPATHSTPHLVAASAAQGSKEMNKKQLAEKLTARISEGRLTMSPELFKAGMKALISDDAEQMKAVLEQMMTAHATGEVDVPPPGAPTEEGSEDSEEEQMSAARLSVERERLRAKEMQIVAREKAANERLRALESKERAELVAELVKLGAELPATAFEDSTNLQSPLCERLQNESLASLRARVDVFRAAQGARATAVASSRSPVLTGGQAVSVDGATVQLSAREVEVAREAKMDLETYARVKRHQFG